MIKVLILAYDFPPYVSVGGLRPYSWYQYLHEFDVYPVVITRQWSNKHGNYLDYIEKSDVNVSVIEENNNGQILRSPYKPNLANKILLKYGENKYRFFRKIVSAYYEFFQWFFVVGPKSGLYREAKKYLLTNKVDVIIATGDPFILFRYANLLSKKYGTPWIADYRDPWVKGLATQDKPMLEKFFQIIEKKLIKQAAGITTVSGFVQNKIFNVDPANRFFIISNGYDQNAIENLQNVQQYNASINLALAGTIFKYHPIRAFLNSCNQYLAETNALPLKLWFYGINNQNEIEGMLTDFTLIQPNVFFIPRLNNKDLLCEIQKCNALILFNNFSFMGTKIYDYLAVKRKILFCFEKDKESESLKNKFYRIHEDDLNQQLQKQLILETNAGVIIENSEHLVQVIKDLAVEIKEKGFVSCDSILVEKYSRKIQTEKLADIIYKFIVHPAKKYQQCSRCVMDTNDPDIIFDENGYCNHCTDYIEKTSKRIYQGTISDLQFEQLIEKIKRSGRNHDYDCVIGISGGVDSLYTAFIAKKMGLRVLCVHMDNGWNSELATHNIEKILKKLDMELVTEVLDWEEFRDLQLSFLKASVPEAETPTDIAIPAVLHKVAAKYNIRYILSGGNFATEGILPKSWHYDAKDVKYLKAVHKKFGTKKLRSFPTFGFQKEMYYKFIKGIRMVYPLNYVPYNKKEAIKILEQELGWKNYGGKHHESLYTKFIQSYLLYEKFGIDYRRATYSTQICAGEITREDALHELCEKPYDPVKLEDEKEYISKKLSISCVELEKIIALPPKSFKDYPNNQKILEFIYNIYRKINK